MLKILKKEGKITDAVIESMLSWRHSGFNVYVGNKIFSDDTLKGTRKAGLGNLYRYIIRACFSQERMVYIPAKNSDDGTAKVIYTSKDLKFRKIFNALDWVARLIQKIYEVDPLICPKCWEQMHIISFIEELDIIEKSLRHLGLWAGSSRYPGKQKAKKADHTVDSGKDSQGGGDPETLDEYKSAQDNTLGRPHGIEPVQPAGPGDRRNTGIELAGLPPSARP